MADDMTGSVTTEQQPFSVEQALKQRDKLLADLKEDLTAKKSAIDVAVDRLAELRKQRAEIEQAIRELTPRQRRAQGGAGGE